VVQEESITALQLSRYAPWTAFKSQFCGFAAQNIPQNRNLKTAA
jgi:hypothetical protein